MYYLNLLYFWVLAYPIFFGLIFSISILVFWLTRTTHINLEVTYWTYFSGFVYLMFYNFYFVYLRFLSINKTIDLKAIYNIIKQFIIKLGHQTLYLEIVYILFIIFIILLWILIFLRLRKQCHFNLWKTYWYNKYKYLLTSQDLKKHYEAENIFFNYSFIHMCNKISSFLFDLTGKLHWKKLQRFCYHPTNIRNFIYFFFFVLLLGIFIFECIFGSFVLYYTLYYLLFYFIFLVWYRISMFFYYEQIELDQVLFEDTYCYPNVCYFEVNEELQKLLYNYLKVSSSVAKQHYHMLVSPYDISPLIYYNRYILVNAQELGLYDETGNPIDYKEIYKNDYTKSCIPRNISDRDTWSKFQFKHK